MFSSNNYILSYFGEIFCDVSDSVFVNCFLRKVSLDVVDATTEKDFKNATSYIKKIKKKKDLSKKIVVGCRGVQPVNPSSATPTKWSNTLKQLVGKLTFCLIPKSAFVPEAY